MTEHQHVVIPHPDPTWWLRKVYTTVYSRMANSELLTSCSGLRPPVWVPAWEPGVALCGSCIITAVRMHQNGDPPCDRCGKKPELMNLVTYGAESSTRLILVLALCDACTRKESPRALGELA